ncbi:MAG: hypothetical protein LBU20_00285 [Candidatus Nomurabacteria bacterium]|jgi:guanylate kinase|nr:hypothetical protein [Candidatus Nomurabacteria bacterium]
MKPESKFVLLGGPSGVGKSSVISEVVYRSREFTYISPYVTRTLREDESDKVHISDQTMDEMQAAGELLTVNEIYGVRYGTPIAPIWGALRENRYPILDWPVDKRDIISHEFGKRALMLYLMPPSVEGLKVRLNRDNRDPSGCRINKAIEELAAVESGVFDGDIDYRLVSEDGQIAKLAETVIEIVLGKIKPSPT